MSYKEVDSPGPDTKNGSTIFSFSRRTEIVKTKNEKKNYTLGKIQSIYKNAKCKNRN